MDRSKIFPVHMNKIMKRELRSSYLYLPILGLDRTGALFSPNRVLSQSEMDGLGRWKVIFEIKIQVSKNL
jgi:hypothetical protein